MRHGLQRAQRRGELELKDGEWLVCCGSREQWRGNGETFVVLGFEHYPQQTEPARRSTLGVW